MKISERPTGFLLFLGFLLYPLIKKMLSFAIPSS